MAKIQINNPRQIINGGAKKYYFKVKGLGGPKGDKGDKGDTGATGPQGPQGNAATVSVGSTTTLPVGYDATVENVGSIYNAVLDFGIPQGPQGPQGAKGDKGDTGAQGETGPRGPQGERGTNATVYVGTTSTLNPGSQATVYNSGTDSNAVLNFGIPKGEKGDTGPMPTITQTTGQAIDQVMSQKATTDALNTKQATITNSNKLSADLVTDTTTTNKFVTAEDKTTWNAKQNALTAGQGIDITSDVISTPALVPEVVASLPAEGTEGKLYLTPKAHTTQAATGNPITTTVTEEAGKIESFQLDGDTVQNGTPTPESPVEVQTVTGTQTISVNGTNYSISLGTIELCKLGTYQDYIYENDGKWYVHNAIGKYVYNNDLTQNGISSGVVAMITPTLNIAPNLADNIGTFYSNMLTPTIVSNTGIRGTTSISKIRVQISTRYADSYNGFKALAAANNLTIYFPLATTSDTEITNTSLIAQLEAIRRANLENGTNTITNSTPAPNLAGDMEIGYYGYNPTNRYDKFIWLDLNNNYEQIGS